MNTWINCDATTKIGDRGYLVEIVNTSQRGARYLHLYGRPLRTNQSLRPRLEGWCGETDNRSKTALGAVQIVKLNKAGDRACVRELDRAALCSFLASDGHPNLIPDAYATAWNRGIDDGFEHVQTVLREDGREAAIAPLSPGHVSFDEPAINAGAHRAAGVAEELRDIYYAAYEEAARDAAIEIRDGAAA